MALDPSFCLQELSIVNHDYQLIRKYFLTRNDEVKCMFPVRTSSNQTYRIQLCNYPVRSRVHCPDISNLATSSH